MKYKLLPIILSGLLLVGCNSNDKKPVTPPDPEFEEFIIDFTSFDLSPYTNNLLQSSDSRFQSAVISFLNENCNGLVTSIDYSDANKIRINRESFPSAFESPQALVLASQNYDGYLKMNFSKTLYSVKIKAQQYYSITGGYSNDPHYYPYYDCQLYNEETYEYTGDPDTAIFINEEPTHIEAITYKYDEDGYPEPNIPPICTEEVAINGDSLELWAWESYRIRVFELTLKFEK